MLEEPEGGREASASIEKALGASNLADIDGELSTVAISDLYNGHVAELPFFLSMRYDPTRCGVV